MTQTELDQHLEYFRETREAVKFMLDKITPKKDDFDAFTLEGYYRDILTAVKCALAHEYDCEL